MLTPTIRQSYISSASKWVVDFSEKWFVRYLLRPTLIILPAAVVTASIENDKVRDVLKNILGPTFGGYVDQSALILFVGVFAYTSALDAIFAGLKVLSEPERELSRQDLIAILKSINVVTGDKARRFAELSKRIASLPSIQSRAAFNEITKPDQQIALLVSAVRSVFEFVDSGTEYRVGLLLIENGAPTEWAHFDPATRPPRTSPRDLCNPSSTVMRTIRAKSTVVVEDIGKELSKKGKAERRYIKGSMRDGDQGSQLCYPLVHPATNAVEYILTIAGDKRCCMPEKHLPLFEWIIQPFALRLNLEHSLILIKKRISDE